MSLKFGIGLAAISTKKYLNVWLNSPKMQFYYSLRWKEKNMNVGDMIVDVDVVKRLYQ